MASSLTVPTFSEAKSARARECRALFGYESSQEAREPRRANVDPIAIKDDFRSLVQSVQKNYGPLQMKADVPDIQLNWELSKQRFLSGLGNVKRKSDADIAKARLFNSFNDAHVSVQMPSSLTWKLPMQFASVENKMILNYFVAEEVPGFNLLAEVGDELVKINGMTPDEFQKTDPVFNKNASSITNKSIFGMTLVGMKEASGLPLSRRSPDVTFVLRKANGQEYEIKTTYKQAGVGLLDGDTPLPVVVPDTTPKPLRKPVSLYMQGSEHLRGLDPVAFDMFQRQLGMFNRMTDLKTELPMAADDSSDEDETKPKGKGVKFEIGKREPFFQLPNHHFKLPNDFTEIRPPKEIEGIFNADDFFAGTFKRNGKTVGFLRIPAYDVKLKPTILISLRFYIAQLQAKSDYLVFDQTNNPGGMVAYSDLVVKSFVGQYDDANHMQFLVKPTQGFLREFASLLNSIETDSAVLTPTQKEYFVRRLREDYEKINKAYQAGSELTEPVSLRLISEYFEVAMQALTAKMPLVLALKQRGLDLSASQVYTKKVIMFINELDFSGGDATPATLQDYNRVTLVGVRTAGAGGSVEAFQDRVSSDFTYRLTTSLMYRKGGKLVENEGVHPDVNFTLTVDDYKTNFRTTLERLLQTVETSGK